MITKDCQNNKHIYLLYILNMWNILRHLSNLLINGITKYYSENINTARIRIHHVLDRYRFLFLPPVTYRRPRLRAHFATPDTFRCEGKNRRRNHRSLAQSAYEFASRSRVTHSRSSIIAKRSPPRGRKTPRCPVNSTAYNHRCTYDCFGVCSERHSGARLNLGFRLNQGKAGINVRRNDPDSAGSKDSWSQNEKSIGGNGHRFRRKNEARITRFIFDRFWERPLTTLYISVVLSSINCGADFLLKRLLHKYVSEL